MALPYLEHVFKISGTPTYTFVEPQRYGALKVALRTPGRGVIIEGPSGIGKSTAVNRALQDLKLAAPVQTLSARVPQDAGVIAMLPETTGFGIVLVDDFHILDVDVRRSIANLLKRLADTEDEHSKVILVGINQAGDRLTSHAPDLANRIDVFRFEAEPDEKVEQLLQLGEAALGVSFAARADIVEACRGSFYLAQMIAHEMCTQAGVTEATGFADGSGQEIDVSYSTVRRVVRTRLGSKFDDPLRIFARGTRFRPAGRTPYLQVLRWLADAPAWTISLQQEMGSHPNERASVGQIVEKGYLATLIARSELSALFHFDAESTGKWLTIEDPQLIYYLRTMDWEEFARKVGFMRSEWDNPYDFALSFAGEDRPFAESLKDALEDLGHSVFYDMNEQHRIIGNSIEEFLEPIYRSKATFVLAVLGPHYGEKRWTRFESEAFRERWTGGEVIPVWSRDSLPTAFDEKRDVGRFTYDAKGDLRGQAEKVAEVCSKKLETGGKSIA
jgi:hypothetical protein